LNWRLCSFQGGAQKYRKNRDAGIDKQQGRYSQDSSKRSWATSGGVLGTPVKGSLKSSGISTDCFRCDDLLSKLEKEVAAVVDDDAEAELEELAATLEV
jgi:hypothetical protein